MNRNKNHNVNLKKLNEFLNKNPKFLNFTNVNITANRVMREMSNNITFERPNNAIGGTNMEGVPPIDPEVRRAFNINAENYNFEENKKRNSAATKIAATVKARQAAKKFQEKRKAATTIAAAVKGQQARQSLQRLKESQKKLKEQNFRRETNAMYMGMQDFPQTHVVKRFRQYLNKYKQFSGNSKYQLIKQAIENYNKIKPGINNFSAFLAGVNKTNAKRRLRAYKIRCAKLGTKLVNGSEICQNRKALMLKVDLETLNPNAPNAQTKLSAMISKISQMPKQHRKLLQNTAARAQSKISKK